MNQANKFNDVGKNPLSASFCHGCSSSKKIKGKADYTVALAGNANVGKSTIFNQLTGVDQIIGNWPGKTVEKAEGILQYKGLRIKVVDLPGIYSFSTFSTEELISRDYIASEKPDAVVNIVDATALERNLFFTFQLLELNAPLVIALNQIDRMEKKGIFIDIKKLEEILGVPVIPTTATLGKGISELSEQIVMVAKCQKFSIQSMTEGWKPSFFGYNRKILKNISYFWDTKNPNGFFSVSEHAQEPPTVTSDNIIPSFCDWRFLTNRKSTLTLKYGKEVEKRIGALVSYLNNLEIEYPSRWIAIKLLEKDPEITKMIEKKDKNIISKVQKLINELEKIHGHPSNILITSERYSLADEIAKKIQHIEHKKYSLTERIDKIALHPFFGYILIAAVVIGLLVWTFVIGFWISGFLSSWLGRIEQLEPVVNGSLWRILWNGAFSGFVAGVTLIIPYVLPFYILLAFIEDSGYLTRISLLLDRGMHKLGLHGKAIIPLILGYGCSVPACFSCRIMETEKQKLVSSFLVTLIPCTARTVVILGLVAAFVNIWWALGLFVFDILLIIILGRIAFKVVPGDSVGLIMEMPNYHLPSLKLSLKQTWARTKSILWIVFPAYILGSALVQVFYAYGWLEPINNFLTPITVGWLGLPAVVGILLIFGIVRKELTILMLAAIFQTTNFTTILTFTQMIVLSLVTMLYIPCLATFLALVKEFNWKKATAIAVFEIVFAILIGGIASRALIYFI